MQKFYIAIKDVLNTSCEMDSFIKFDNMRTKFLQEASLSLSRRTRALFLGPTSCIIEADYFHFLITLDEIRPLNMRVFQ